MAKQRESNAPVASSVNQPPCVNRSEIMITRMVTQSVPPTMWIQMWLFQSGCLLRVVIQYRIIATWVSENVRKTLIEYITTSASTAPRGFARPQPRRANGPKAVRDRRGAGVRAAAQRVRREEDQGQPAEPQRGEPLRDAGGNLPRPLVHAAQMRADAGADDDGVGDEEGEE